MSPAQILDYITAHPWAGWLLLGALSLLVSRKSQIDAWAEKNPRAAGAMKLLRSLGIDPWMLVQSLTLIFRGRLPVKLQAAQIVAAAGTRVSPAILDEVAKQSSPPPPKDDDLPPTPRTGSGAPPMVALLIAVAFALSGALPACGKQALPPGCTEADFAALAMTCPSEDECNRMNEEKRAKCTEKVEAE
jgi:hypothetical protein